MSQNLRGETVTNTNVKQHSSQLHRNLSQVAKSLSARPQELRGPFNVRSQSVSLKASSGNDKKK
jgi:hypothetical protein